MNYIKSLLLFLSLLILRTEGFSQKMSIAQLIDAWKVSDTSQTRLAELTYMDLRSNDDPVLKKLKLDSLDEYAGDHASELRIKTRIAIYHMLAVENLNFTENDRRLLNEARKWISVLKDDQLTSEFYSLAAFSHFNANNNPKAALFYSLKVLDMQKKIGFAYFPNIYMRLLEVSRHLYNQGQFRLSINYGFDALKWAPKQPITGHYLHLLDNLGASYFQLNNADSSRFYYQKLSQIVESQMVDNPAFTKTWKGIAKGGIGKAALIKGNIEAADTLLHQNIISSIEMMELKDAAQAMGFYGQVKFLQNKKDSAFFYWHNSLANLTKANDLLNSVAVLDYIYNAFKKINRSDSALFYAEKYALYRDSLLVQNSRSQLSLVQAQLDFDNAEQKLADANSKIQLQKNVRNALIIGLILLAVIGLLFFNRYHIKQKLREEQISREKAFAEMEAKHAMEQVDIFAENIRQKEALIGKLKIRLGNNLSDPEVFENLKNYSLITNESWKKFRSEFQKAYPHFYPALNSCCQNLTPAEERLCALLLLQMNTDEIADSLGIARDSVAKSKRRFLTKYNLSSFNSMEDFIDSINQG